MEVGRISQVRRGAEVAKKLFTLLDLCVSSLRRGHANLLCIVPILTDDPRRESEGSLATHLPISGAAACNRTAAATVAVCHKRHAVQACWEG